MGNLGTPGPTGNTGAQGAVGNLGTQGPTGNTGAQGAVGNLGTQGPTGNTGAQGAVGNLGTPGPTGNTGAQGSQGTPATQGPQGNVGGTQGAQGNTGAQGAQGPTCTGLAFRYIGISGNSCAALCTAGGTSATLYSRVITACPGAASGNYIFPNLANCQSNTTGNGQAGSQFAVCQAYCGTWIAGGTWQTPTSCSDAKLKESIEVLKDSLENIMKLDVVEFDWNDKLPVPDFYANLIKNKKIHSIGLIAQNVKKYFPEAVGFNHGYYSINYAKLNAVLVEGIKAQQILIEEIDKELNFIESKLN